MTKRILSAVILLTLLFTLTACISKNVIITNDSSKEQVASQTESSANSDAQSKNNTASTPTETSKAESQKTNVSQITREKAKSIAFEHAGVKEADVYDLEIEFDSDDGVKSYEIEFKSERIEYKYDIHAETGEILKSEKDRDD